MQGFKLIKVPLIALLVIGVPVAYAIYDDTTTTQEKVSAVVEDVRVATTTTTETRGGGSTVAGAVAGSVIAGHVGAAVGAANAASGRYVVDVTNAELCQVRVRLGNGARIRYEIGQFSADMPRCLLLKAGDTVELTATKHKGRLTLLRLFG